MFVPVVTNQLTLATMPISRFRHVSGTFPARSRLVFGTFSEPVRHLSATLFRTFSGYFRKVDDDDDDDDDGDIPPTCALGGGGRLPPRNLELVA